MLSLWILIACGGKDTGTQETGAETGVHETGAPDTGETTETAESGETEETDTAVDFCEDAPEVTYESFGRGFLTGNCQGCHASTAAERYGAPEEVTFDTVEEVWAQVDSVLSAATTYDGDEPDMPPQGGVSEDDQTRLQWWLRCATPGT